MEAIIIVFIVIGLPVIGGLIFAGYLEYLKYQRQGGNLRGKIKELERRVEVLETIVTSSDYELQRTVHRLQGAKLKSLPLQDEKGQIHQPTQKE